MGLFGNWLPIQRYIIIFPVEVATQLGGNPLLWTTPFITLFLSYSPSNIPIIYIYI